MLEEGHQAEGSCPCIPCNTWAPSRSHMSTLTLSATPEPSLCWWLALGSLQAPAAKHMGQLTHSPSPWVQLGQRMIQTPLYVLLCSHVHGVMKVFSRNPPAGSINLRTRQAITIQLRSSYVLLHAPVCSCGPHKREIAAGLQTLLIITYEH